MLTFIKLLRAYVDLNKQLKDNAIEPCLASNYIFRLDFLVIDFLVFRRHWNSIKILLTSFLKHGHLGKEIFKFCCCFWGCCYCCSCGDIVVAFVLAVACSSSGGGSCCCCSYFFNLMTIDNKWPITLITKQLPH